MHLQLRLCETLNVRPYAAHRPRPQAQEKARHEVGAGEGEFG